MAPRSPLAGKLDGSRRHICAVDGTARICGPLAPTMSDQKTTAHCAININSERLLPLTEVPQYLRSRGAKAPHVSGVYRWALAGVGGVRLQTIRVGGVLHTSAEAIARFVTELSGAGGEE